MTVTGYSDAALCAAGDCSPTCPVCDALDLLDHVPGEFCSVCSDGFTVEEWEVRHTASDLSDVHAGCCDGTDCQVAA